MILKYNYWYFKKAVPIKTCEKILKVGRKKLKEKLVLDQEERLIL